MSFHRPFLRFLEAEPNEAIESITRLVNHATERWAQRFLRKAPSDLDPDHYSLSSISLPVLITLSEPSTFLAGIARAWSIRTLSSARSWR